MRDQSIWYLENLDVSGIFCRTKLNSFTKHHVLKKFDKGSYIYMPDESADKIFFINDGRVKVGTYNDTGKEIVKAILSKGEIFGELSMIGQEKRQDFALAMDRVEVCVMSTKEMNELMRDRSSLSLFFMKIMGSRVLDMEKRLESLVFKDSRSRIVEFLINMVKNKGQRVGYEYVVRQFITHQDIANLTATSRQTVTTVLNELRTKNLLTFNRKRLLVRNLEQLEAELSTTI